MNIQTIIPAPPIADYVSRIFVLENCKLCCDVGLPLTANGFPGLAFQTTGSTLILDQHKTIDNLFLFGQTITPINLHTNGQLTLITYFFYPHSLQTLFGLNALELTDQLPDLYQVPAARNMNLREQLFNATSLNSRIGLLNSFVLKLIERNQSATKHGIFFATETIRKSKGLFPLENIRQQLNVSERTFRRLFDTYVGVSPKLFSRICQFDATFQQLNQHQFSRLSDIAYENGFSDQSHLIRTFKEFTNNSPTQYLKHSSAFLDLNR